MKSPGTSALRRGRASIHNQIYHLIGCTRHRQPHFSNFTLARALAQSFHTTAFHSKTLCFVIMPDHFHWLMQFDLKDESISKVIQRTKAKVARAAAKNLGIRHLWQKGFYDRAIRNEDDLPAVARYIVANPIRAGLVRSLRFYSHWDAIWLDP